MSLWWQGLSIYWARCARCSKTSRARELPAPARLFPNTERTQMTLSPGYWIAALTVATSMFVVGAQAAQPGGAQSSASEINLTADKLSTGNGSNQIEASGNVQIKREATTLKADEGRLHRATQ